MRGGIVAPSGGGGALHGRMLSMPVEKREIRGETGALAVGN
jgi:hypothetical protein